MRSVLLIVAAMTGLSVMMLPAYAQDGSTEKSAPVKGPPNANGAEGATPHSEKMKGPPNANGYDSDKASSGSKAK